MSKKTINTLYYLSTGIVTLTLIIGAFLYLTHQPRIVHAFSNTMINGDNAIGFPAWLIIPMGIAKLLGAIALWIPFKKWIREWAYAGAFFNFLLAVGAHIFNPINPNDSDFAGALIPLIFVIISRYTLFMREKSMS